MAIKERKQITGTEAQIKAFAGHEGVLAYATDTKRLHVLSGTAGQTTELANKEEAGGLKVVRDPATGEESLLQGATIKEIAVHKSTDSSEGASVTLVSKDYENNFNRVAVLPSLTTVSSQVIRNSLAYSNETGSYPPEEHTKRSRLITGVHEKLDKTLELRLEEENPEHFAKIPTLEYTNEAISESSSNKINVSGDRGKLAGYESASEGTRIDNNSPDSQTTDSSSITVATGDDNTSWTKVICLRNAGNVTLESRWNWAGGKAPEIKLNAILVCHWNSFSGIANIINPS